MCLAFVLLGLPAAAFAAPVTTLVGVPGGWSNTDVTFTLQPDTTADSYYILGGGQSVWYLAPVTVSDEGETPIAYWSVSNDCHDYIESPNYSTIRIDKSAPVSSISGLPAYGSGISSFTFSINATDTYSGVAQKMYRIDGGTPQAYSSPVHVNAVHTTVIDYWSVDVAGNVESPKSAIVTVDTGLPQTMISGVPATWSRSDVTFSLTAAGSASSGQPVTGTFYQIGSGAVSPYGSPVKIGAEGVSVVSYYSVDAAGSREATRSDTIRIDKTAPVTTVSGIPGAPSRSAITFSLNATDAVSGVSAIRYKLDDSAVSTYMGPVTFGQDGSTTLTYWSVDAAGNAETPKTALIQIDLGVPVTTVSGVPSGWSNTDVSVTLSATTGSGFSTVAGTYYIYGLGSETAYTGPVTLDQEGSRTLWYYSVSSTGVRETTHTVQVKIDKTAPSSNVSGIPSGTSATAVTFSLAANDALSGVSAIRYQLGAGPAQDYTGPVTVSADGVTTLTYWAVDAAGNSEASHSAQITISHPPLTVPETAIGGVPAGWSSKDVTFTLTPYSPGHAVTGIYYRIGSGAPTAYAGPVAIGAEGVTTVTYHSTDDAGGIEADKTAQIRIDKTRPTSSVSGLPAADTIVPGPVVFSLSASDGLSGVAAIKYKFDTGFPIDYTGPVTVDYQGTTLLTWWAVDAAGNVEAEHSALIRIGAPAGGAQTSATIKSTATSVRIGSIPVLSGTVTPDTLIGKVMVVYVQKPGSARWTYSSNRVVYTAAGHAAWLYKYFFKPGMAKGTYRFKAVVPASPGFLTSESKTISVGLK